MASITQNLTRTYMKNGKKFSNGRKVKLDMQVGGVNVSLTDISPIAEGGDYDCFANKRRMVRFMVHRRG